MNALEKYDWPGNILELRNVMERIAVTSDGEEVTTGEITSSLTISN